MNKFVRSDLTRLFNPNVHPSPAQIPSKLTPQPFAAYDCTPQGVYFPSAETVAKTKIAKLKAEPRFYSWLHI